MALTYQMHRFAEQPLRLPKNLAGLSKARLARAIEFIEENLAQNIGLDDVANVVGLSPCHFSRAFRHETGQSPRQLLTDHPIARAQALLQHGHIPLAAVAYAVGFSSQAHLTTAFRKALGTTPGAYRRQLQ
jgi:AraC family transcriptional regulator